MGKVLEGRPESDDRINRWGFDVNNCGARGFRVACFGLANRVEGAQGQRSKAPPNTAAMMPRARASGRGKATRSNGNCAAS